MDDENDDIASAQESRQALRKVESWLPSKTSSRTLDTKLERLRQRYAQLRLKRRQELELSLEKLEAQRRVNQETMAMFFDGDQRPPRR